MGEKNPVEVLADQLTAAHRRIHHLELVIHRKQRKIRSLREHLGKLDFARARYHRELGEWRRARHPTT